MNNHEIANYLESLGALIEIAGANAFRVRAFRRAAEAIEGHDEALSAIATVDQLTKIDGIGKSIALTITQLIETGTSDAWEEVSEEVPISLLNLLQIRTLGPKKVAKLWRDLEITDLNTLKEALDAGRVQKLRGFGKKSVETITKEIGRLARAAGRTPIAQALPQADHLLSVLEAHPATTKVALAGSLRRGAETIGDLDFVALCEGDPLPVMQAFRDNPESAEALAFGPSKTTIRLKSGLHADLRVFEPGHWGASLHHFTGSKFHHIELRARAKDRGLKISEYGLVNEAGERIAGATEQELYEALELDYIVPELREGHGEVDAAAKHQLPRLITLRDLKGDLHMHTKASDGTATVAQMAQAAKERGYQYLCITEHSQSTSIANGLDAKRLKDHLAHIKAVDQESEGIHILAGIEVDILKDGSLDLPHELLQQLDLVVASVHAHFNLSEDEMTARMIRAIESGCVHIIGHPTGRQLGRRDPYPLDLDAIFGAAKKHRVALELNADPHRLDLKDTHARQAKKAGVTLAINSDAHSVRALSNIHFGVTTARRGWLEAQDVLNTKTIEELKTWLKR